MEDFITPVKTTKKVQSSIKKFEALTVNDNQSSKKESKSLPPNTQKSSISILEIDGVPDGEPIIKASSTQPKSQKTLVHEVKTAEPAHKRHDSTAFRQQSYLGKSDSLPSLPDNAREILRSQPGQEDLNAVLQYLQCGIDGQHDFNIRITSPKAAQLVNVLVTYTVPDVWTNIKAKELSEDEARMKKTIISSLSSVAGIGALVAQIKHLITTKSSNAIIVDTIMVLGAILKYTKAVSNFLSDAQTLYQNEVHRRLYWQEITTLLGGSKVLSTVAQALQLVHTDANVQSYLWLGDGLAYSQWLANNIAVAAQKINGLNTEYWNFLSQLVKRGFSLGHRDSFVSEIYTRLLLGQKALWTPVHLILKNLGHMEQKSFIDAVLTDMSRKYLASAGGPAVAYSQDPSMQKIVAGAAALIAGLIKNNDILEEHIIGWLGNGHGSAITIGIASRRALIAAFGRSEDALRRILEKSLTSFGDKLQIRHASITQQEANAQTILLVVGYLDRFDKTILKRPSFSTLVMHAVSNRLAASVPKSRFLGMIVGTAISRLVDQKDSTLDFEVEEMETEEARLWLGLTSIADHIGELNDLRSSYSLLPKAKSAIQNQKSQARPIRNQNHSHKSKIIAIEELSDSVESEDDDLMPYQKPDSDPEDSDEDPTLINRDKPSAPVYIVDLIKQLQNTEKPDVLSLALKTAPSLIRRKTGFGTEVSSNVHTLVTILVNLQEGMPDHELQQLRLESLIACLVAKPELVGPTLAELYFQGDFSLSQRIVILTTIGLGTRELAGFENDQKTSSSEVFPSKRLPPHLEPGAIERGSNTPNPVAVLAETAAHEAVRPMALAAADKMTGPSVLKIRTFSSRMEVEKKTQQKNVARTKLIPKNLHRLLMECFYLPLCSRMTLLLSSSPVSNVPNTTILHTSTLKLFIQTLTLILHTLGPSASLHLPTLTHETLLLLINLHVISYLSTDPAILPALLHLLLALLDTTVEAGTVAQERLITEYGAQIAELVNWSNSLGRQINVQEADVADEGLPWTVLAAGIQVKWYEMGRRFQGRMLGLTVDEMDQLEGS